MVRYLYESKIRMKDMRNGRSEGVGEFYAQISKELAVPNFAVTCGRPPRLDGSRKDRRGVPED